MSTYKKYLTELVKVAATVGVVLGAAAAALPALSAPAWSVAAVATAIGALAAFRKWAGEHGVPGA